MHNDHMTEEGLYLQINGDPGKTNYKTDLNLHSETCYVWLTHDTFRQHI